MPEELFTAAECANCGAPIPRHAKACPECGADERTGWRETSLYDDLDLPDEAFADERHGVARAAPHRQRHCVVLVGRGALPALVDPERVHFSLTLAWDIAHRKGIHLPQIGWWARCSEPDAAVVHHARPLDHVARHPEIICTPATARFLHARIPGRRVITELKFEQRHALEFGVTATLHAAGHILGSAQILLESADHGSLLYTGDFKLRPVSRPSPAPRRAPTR